MPKKASRSSKHTPVRHITPTGVRRFFFKLELLGKRRSTDLPFDYSNLDPIVDTPPEKAPTRDHFHPAHAYYGKENKQSLPPPLLVPTFSIHNIPWPERVALINEDHTEDAVVITTLDRVPFCCHEDLITMSRDQLVRVAFALNARLPTALEIDTHEGLAASWIRASIERVVGIRADVPRAPRVVKVLRDSIGRVEGRRMGGSGRVERTPPTSPLASRSQQLGSFISPGLDKLVEEDEDADEDDEEGDRHSKKRKLVFQDTGGESDSDVVMASDTEQTPTPRPHLQRALFNAKASPSPPPIRVLRSHSQSIGRDNAIDTSFLHEGRPQRYQRKAMKEKVEAKIDQEVLAPIGAPRRSGRLRPISRPHVPLDPVESSMAARSEGDTGVKRKRGAGSFGREVTQHVTSGFNRMSMTEWCSDGMDVSI